MNDFSRVSAAIADEICKLASVKPNMKATDVHGDIIDRLHRALGQVKVMAPPATSVVPIGEELLIEGLKRRFPAAEFYISTTRPPSVYRGNPFVVEVGLAYGGELPGDEPADIMRFANRVPLQYQPKACAISESVYETNWKAYNLPQPKGSLPQGPLAIAVHLASVWVPFTSEAKEAVAHYDELLREMKLALQEVGRKLGTHLRARDKALGEQKRLSIFQRYIPEVANAMGEILGSDKEKIEKSFYKALPNFVKVESEDDGGAPPPPPAAAAPPEVEAAPAAKPSKKSPKKPAKAPPPSKKKKRGEQLTLLH